ncbi:MAG: hypothetical protein WCL59_12390, partial [Cyanobium sp. ELA507]
MKVNLAHHALDAFGVVIDLGHVFPPGFAGPRPARGPGLLLPGKSMSKELHEHQGLVNVAHAHAFRD